MVEAQLDDIGVFGKITPDMIGVHFDTRERPPFAMRLNHHTYLPIKNQMEPYGSNEASLWSIIAGARRTYDEKRAKVPDLTPR
jgi:hypothetical protein